MFYILQYILSLSWLNAIFKTLIIHLKRKTQMFFFFLQYVNNLWVSIGMKQASGDLESDEENIFLLINLYGRLKMMHNNTQCDNINIWYIEQYYWPKSSFPFFTHRSIPFIVIEKWKHSYTLIHHILYTIYINQGPFSKNHYPRFLVA